MAVNALSRFSTLLDHFDPSAREDVLAYFRLLHEVGEAALVELLSRLAKSITSRDFRLLLMETAFYYPWRGWVEPITRVLRHESDLGIFEAGIRSLAHMRSNAASESLKELYGIRHAPAFQELLSQALILDDPQAAFTYHYSRLLEGSGNPQVANDAATELGKIVEGTHLLVIQELVHHADILIARHALRLITLIPTREAARFLLEHLKGLHRGSIEDQLLRDALNEYRGFAGAGMREKVLKATRDHLGDHVQEILATLDSDPTPASPDRLEALRDQATGAHERFQVEAACLVLEGKLLRLPAFFKETGEAVHRRGRWLAPTMDAVAEGLQRMVVADLIPRGEVLESLSLAYERQTGGEGLARALGHLVGPEDHRVLDLLLAGLNSALRGAALEAVGSRQDPGLGDFLLRACRDPIVDIAERCMVYFGHLPEAAGVAREMLASQNPVELRLAIRIAAINRMAELVPALIAFLASCDREDLVLDAYDALGTIGTEEAVHHLLDSLHSGQSPRVLAAIATALRDAMTVDAAYGLAERASSIRNPQVHVLAAEAILLVHGDPSNPLPRERAPLLRAQIQPCWEDKDPWPFRLRLIPLMGSLYCEAPDGYTELGSLVGNLLADRKNQSAWTIQQQAEAQAIQKRLEQRAAGAGA